MRTTIAIPNSLVKRVDALVGRGGITTRNQLIVEALEHWVKLKTDVVLDNQFAEMAEDENYLNETLAIEQEFQHSDREVERYIDSHFITN